MQFHIRILETSQENIASLIVGLEYLIDISYVDDTEVFKVWVIVRLERVGQPWRKAFLLYNEITELALFATIVFALLK